MSVEFLTPVIVVVVVVVGIVEMIIKMKISGTSFEFSEYFGKEAWLFVNAQHFCA